MGHFAELMVFNDFNSISFRAAAKAAFTPTRSGRCFLKNNIRRLRLWQEVAGSLSSAPPCGRRAAQGFRRSPERLSHGHCPTLSTGT
jgi:hypothetical protein